MYLLFSHILLFIMTTSAIPLAPSTTSRFVTHLSRRSCSSVSYATRITCTHQTASLAVAREAIAIACEPVTRCSPGTGPYPFGAGVAGNATSGGSLTAFVKIGEQCIDGVTALSPKRCRKHFESFVSAQCGGGELREDEFALGTVYFLCDGSVLSMGETMGMSTS